MARPASAPTGELNRAFKLWRQRIPAIAIFPQIFSTYADAQLRSFRPQSPCTEQISSPSKCQTTGKPPNSRTNSRCGDLSGTEILPGTVAERRNTESWRGQMLWSLQACTVVRDLKPQNGGLHNLFECRTGAMCKKLRRGPWPELVSMVAEC